MIELQKYTKGQQLIYDTDKCRVIGCKHPSRNWSFIEEDELDFIVNMYCNRFSTRRENLISTKTFKTFKDVRNHLFLEAL